MSDSNPDKRNPSPEQAFDSRPAKVAKIQEDVDTTMKDAFQLLPGSKSQHPSRWAPINQDREKPAQQIQVDEDYNLEEPAMGELASDQFREYSSNLVGLNNMEYDPESPSYGDVMTNIHGAYLPEAPGEDDEGPQDYYDEGIHSPTMLRNEKPIMIPQAERRSAKLGEKDESLLTVDCVNSKTGRESSLYFRYYKWKNLDWNSRRHIDKINSWRNQIWGRANMKMRKVICWHADEDAFFDLYMGICLNRALSDQIKMPTAAQICEDFNDFFRGRVLQDKHGQDMDPRPYRNLASFNSKYNRLCWAIKEANREILTKGPHFRPVITEVMFEFFMSRRLSDGPTTLIVSNGDRGRKRGSGGDKTGSKTQKDMTKEKSDAKKEKKNEAIIASRAAIAKAEDSDSNFMHGWHALFDPLLDMHYQTTSQERKAENTGHRLKGAHEEPVRLEADAPAYNIGKREGFSTKPYSEEQKQATSVGIEPHKVLDDQVQAASILLGLKSGR